jgi:ubiquinone/menaquinone biosynthesis C-methylase UbiE
VNPNYDAIAETYDQRYLENDYSGVKQALIAFVGPDLNGRVLEVGCGTWPLAPAASPRHGAFSVRAAR